MGDFRSIIEALFGGQAPDVPPPTPSRLNTGNASVDNASELMPEEQRRVVGQLRAKKQLDVMPLPGIAGSFTPSRGMQVDPTLSLEELAKTLTHEGTHVLQPGGFFDQLFQRTREPLSPADSTGSEYLDKPREREAREAEKLVRRRR